MASVPYNNGVPEVAPDARPPDDYQRIQSSPDDFGGAIARGGEKLAAGLHTAGEFWGQVQTDGVLNDSMKDLNDLTERAKSLQGQEALDQQSSIQQQKDQIIENARSKLGTPEQQHRFDSTIRPFADRYIAGQLSTHFVQQGRVHAEKVNTDAFSLALNNVANAADDPEQVKHFREDARQASVRRVQAAGNGGDPAQVQAAIQSADQAVFKTQTESILANDPVNGASRARVLLEANKSALGEAYAPLMEHVRVRANAQDAHDLAATAIKDSGEAARAGAPQAPQAAGASPVKAGADPASMLRHFEGFSAQPYWDVNHWRVGYGSDTITRADGSIVPVTAMTQVTKEDAERDLQRRANLSTQDVKSQIGDAAFNKLSPEAKASLTSVAYNYGSLAKTPAVVAAAQSGDPKALAAAVQDLSSHNGGVNAKRRATEAANILGTASIPQGQYAAAGGNHAMTLPAVANGVAPAPIYSTPPDVPMDPSPEMGALWNNAAYATPTVAAGPPPPPITPEAHEAAAVKAVLESDKTIEVKNAAIATIKQQFAQAAMAAEATAKSQKIRADQSASDWVTKFSKARQTGATDYTQLYDGILADPSLSWENRLSLGEKMRKISGEPDTAAFGSNWSTVRERMMLPPDDPKHMSFQDALAVPGVTSAGMEDLVKMQKRNREGSGGHLITEMENSGIKYAGGLMKLEQGFGDNFKMPNLRGQRIFDGVVAPYITSTVEEMAARGDRAGIDKFLQTDNLDKIVNRFYPPKQRAADTLGGNLVANAEQHPAATSAMPPPPKGIAAEPWKEVVSQVPFTSKGTPWKYADWAGVVQTLLADPSPENQSTFDKIMDGAGGLKAATVLEKFGVTPTAPAAPAAPAAPVSVAAALESKPAGGAPAPQVAPAPRPVAAQAPAPEPQTLPAGAFYGNEKAPTEADAEKYAREQLTGKLDASAAATAREREGASAIAARRETTERMTAQAPEVLEMNRATEAVRALDRQEETAREHIKSLDAREKAGAHVKTQREEYEQELAQIARQRIAAQARVDAAKKKSK